MKAKYFNIMTGQEIDSRIQWERDSKIIEGDDADAREAMGWDEGPLIRSRQFPCCCYMSEVIPDVWYSIFDRDEIFGTESEVISWLWDVAIDEHDWDGDETARATLAKMTK